VAYEDRDVINNPSIYAEMVQKSGQSLSPCVEVNGHMLADVSGDEVEAYLLKAGVVQPTAVKLFPVEKRSCTTALAAISPTLPPFGRTWLMGKKKSGYECNRRFPTRVRSRSESMCV
jgi:hypothetical protein